MADILVEPVRQPVDGVATEPFTHVSREPQLPMFLIAAADDLDKLQAREEFADAQAFADTETLRAIDGMSRTPPGVVVLEHRIATTAVGKSLIKLIEVDQKLSSWTTRIVALHSEDSDSPDKDWAGQADDVAAVVALGSEAAWHESPHAQSGKQRTPRFLPAEGVEVLVGGNRAFLIDLSTVGAQVLSSSVLRPNQRLRMVLGKHEQEVRLSADVVWAKLEGLTTGPVYRAGLDFIDPDPEAIKQVYAEQMRP